MKQSETIVICNSCYFQIKSYYEMKYSYPEFYRDALPSVKNHLYEMGYLGLIPGEDRTGRRLCVCIPGRAATVTIIRALCLFVFVAKK